MAKTVESLFYYTGQEMLLMGGTPPLFLQDFYTPIGIQLDPSTLEDIKAVRANQACFPSFIGIFSGVSEELLALSMVSLDPKSYQVIHDPQLVGVYLEDKGAKWVRIVEIEKMVERINDFVKEGQRWEKYKLRNGFEISNQALDNYSKDPGSFQSE